MAEGNVQQSTGDFSESRDAGAIQPGNPNEESRWERREREIKTLLAKIKDGEEKTKQSIAELASRLIFPHEIIWDAEAERKRVQHTKQTTSVTFAVKAANEDMQIETQIINYIKKEIQENKLEIKTDFNWKNRGLNSPLVVFCNYSPRIGVDVQVSLRGVQEPKVILIILHYIRRALIKGDLSDDDHLLPDDLKDRTVCIAHFAFDTELYDCKQNRWSRGRLCNDLRIHYSKATNQGKLSRSTKDSSAEMQMLREEIEREKAARIRAEQQLSQEMQQRERTVNANHELEESLQEKEQEKNELQAAAIQMEEQLNQERQQRERMVQELENMRTANQVLEEALQEREQEKTELQTTISTAQQALEEYRSTRESSDWVLHRDEIVLSDTEIGVGGWGKVMEGTFRGCKVAVKLIHDLILSPHNRRLFEREMSIASRCRHPCLLQFIGATNDDQSPLFVTELLDTSLRAVLHERALDPMEIITIALDVAKGLNYLHLSHPAPIIHRDISSANVLLWKHGTQWQGKVSDYGTANFMQYSMTVSPGAVAYSAPEAKTSRQSPKVDAYSFGVLLCEMNIREFPDTAHRNEQVAMVTDPFYRDLIRRCLQHEPEERPDMTQVIALLENKV